MEFENADVIDLIAELPDSLMGEFDERGEPIEQPDDGVDDQPEPPPAGEPAKVEKAEGEETEEAEKDQSKEDKEEAKEASSEEDYVEIPGENGSEPEKVPLSALVESHRKFKAFDGDMVAARNQLETAFTQRMTPILQQQLEIREAYVAKLEEWQEWNPVGKPPDPNVYLDERSEHFDPNRYHRLKHAYDVRKARYDDVSRHIAEERGKNEANKATATKAQMEREAHALVRAWPEVAGGEVLKSFYGDLAKTYGFDLETINSVRDHRVFLMARDAVAYRKMQASGGGEVVAKAKAKLVRSGAKAAPATAAGVKSGRARTALKKTGSLDAAAAALEGLDF